MDSSDASLGQDDEPDAQRRELLIGVAATCLTSLLPAKRAQAASSPAGDAFLTVSKLLTARPSLEIAQAVRLYEALVSDVPGFEHDVEALLIFINDRRVDLGQLQRALDSENSALSTLPRKILTAWYTGVVGDGRRARCITFETSLMFVAVADRLAPPSYCYGPHGSWTRKPGEES